MKKEVKIGLAGIGALLILFFGINYLKGINLFKPESYYYVDFQNINGLSKSSPVFAHGFKVGIVSDIQYNHQNPGHVIVGIEMEQNMKIPTGSHAELVTEMLGTVKMNLIPNLKSNTFIHEEDTIIGYANNGIMGAAESLMPKMEIMLPKLDSILTSLNALLANPALTNTLQNVEELTATFNKTGKQINRLMEKDMPKIAENITSITEDLKTISSNIKETDFAATFSKVDSTLQNVQLLTEKLNRKDNSLGLLMNDTAFYHNLNATAANAASLLNDLQSHPKRYVHFSLFGKKDK